MFSQHIRWEKRGLVVQPRPELWWWRSHCMIPTPESLGGSLVKLYFSGRNDQNQSQIGWVTIDLQRPEHVLDCSREPVLTPGPLGCFDDNGVTPSCIVRDGPRTLLYYIGWNPGSTVRMHLFGGLAVRETDGGEFVRYSNAPIIERSRVDPYLNTAPFVIREDDHWKMYYVAGRGWRHKDLPRYHIRIATSTDGRQWNRAGHVAIDFRDDSENALARPFVLKENGHYRMWFGHKGAAYRMGYAESEDGLNWVRNDEFGGLDVSAGQFDSDMIEYFAICEYGGQKFMFYNGNDYGRHGIGLAVQC